ncbi:MAG TPA: glycosyltransferase family 2 protein [Acidimicrobiia bacterium]|nr:glycosyltransferase family 2 protein [Acidimicrobiia bacterium]
MDASDAASPPTDSPALSVVVLAWDNLALTEAFVDSVRRNTSVDYELIIVDNGSKPDAAAFAETAADRAVLNAENLGFARGMNQGLEAARGELIAFCNNDIVVPPDWAARLIETMRSHPNAGIVVPAITTASNPVTVRSGAGTTVEVLEPFSAPPAGVVYVMRVDTVNALGRWEEEYEVASGEDVDLCFKVWVNDLDIVFDERVLVDHVGHATASKLDDSQQLWALNRRRFLEKWMGPTDPPRLDSCEIERFERNRSTARAVAGWMEKYFTIRDRQRARASVSTAPSSPLVRTLRAAYRRARNALRRSA